MLHNLQAWFRKFSKTQQRKINARKQQARKSQARVELLESRAMMAVDLSIAKVGNNIHTLAPVEDAMTSSFFQGTDTVRGYPADSRSTFRVSSTLR